MQGLSSPSQIFVRMLTGSTITLAIESTDTTLTVLAKLRDKSGTPTDSLRLVFAGKQLHESVTMHAHGVFAGSTLHLEGRLCGGMLLYHCTTKSKAAAIRRNGFRCGSSGIAGGAVYFAASVEDAARKSHYNGVVLVCEVDLGRVHDVGYNGDSSLSLTKVRALNCDSVRIPRNGDPGTEYCVYEPSRVRVVGERPDPTHSSPTSSPRIYSRSQSRRPKFNADDSLDAFLCMLEDAGLSERGMLASGWDANDPATLWALFESKLRSL
jgi:hypothetical protein